MGSRKVRRAGKTDSAIFIAKSEQFVATMEQALSSSQWDSAGLQAVHAVISAADAVVAYYAGVRNADDDHRAAVAVLQETLGSKSASASRHLSRVIAKKNVVEYEQRRLTEKEARDMSRDASRFVAWARGMLP